jgi:hypothetical protein
VKYKWNAELPETLSQRKKAEYLSVSDDDADADDDDDDARWRFMVTSCQTSK